MTSSSKETETYQKLESYRGWAELLCLNRRNPPVRLYHRCCFCMIILTSTISLAAMSCNDPGYLKFTMVH